MVVPIPTPRAVMGSSCASITPPRHDDKDAPQVAVVNQEFARKMFGSQASAMGRYFKLKDGTRRQVVGIVEDGKYFNLTEDQQPAIFLSILQAPMGLLQSPLSRSYVVVRSSPGYSNEAPQQLATAIRNKLRELDRGLPAYIS